jgi:acetylornithine deacetylase
MAIDLLQILADLIAIPSVNPMGPNVEGPEYGEARLGDYLEAFFRNLGLVVARQPVAPGRDNVIARLDGAQPAIEDGPLLLLDVHQDTVPVDGMTIDPFCAQLRDGRVYGRGACDVKGSMAAMLVAIARLAEQPSTQMPTIVIACTVNEENGFTGARALGELWAAGGSPSICPRRPDGCIVAEPTELQIVVAHRGVVRWRCEARGRAVHSSQPERGDNAIYRMGHVLAALEQYAQEVLPAVAEHPRCGRPTLSVGTIHGGTSVNTVPERCWIEIDRRLVPGEQPAAAYQHAADHLARETGIELVHEPPFLEATGLDDGNNNVLAAKLEEAARQCGVQARKMGVAYGTNASAISREGIPTVVFGPGSIAQAHTADEWIEFAEVETASEILYQFCRSGF